MSESQVIDQHLDNQNSSDDEDIDIYEAGSS